MARFWDSFTDSDSDLASISLRSTAANGMAINYKFVWLLPPAGAMRRFQSLFRTLSAVILDRPHMLSVSCHLNTCVHCTHASVCVCLAIIQYDKPKTISKGNKNDNRSQFPYCLLEFVFGFGFAFLLRIISQFSHTNAQHIIFPWSIPFPYKYLPV